MLTVFCGNVGYKWPDVYVHRLDRMVKEYCSVPYRLICVSDHEIDGIHTVPASPIRLDINKSAGAWVKLDYFRLEVSGKGPCIALDLDVTVVGDIACLISGQLSFAHTPRRGVRHVNSSVMAWTPDPRTTGRIYTDNIPYSEHPRGEQEYIAGPHPRLTLDRCYSYKSHLTDETRRQLPPDAAVVFFHGLPTPASDEVLLHDWNRRSWDGFEIRQRTTE